MGDISRSVAVSVVVGEGLPTGITVAAQVATGALTGLRRKGQHGYGVVRHTVLLTGFRHSMQMCRRVDGKGVDTSEGGGQRQAVWLTSSFPEERLHCGRAEGSKPNRLYIARARVGDGFQSKRVPRAGFRGTERKRFASAHERVSWRGPVRKSSPDVKLWHYDRPPHALDRGSGGMQWAARRGVGRRFTGVSKEKGPVGHESIRSIQEGAPGIPRGAGAYRTLELACEPRG